VSKTEVLRRELECLAAEASVRHPFLLLGVNRDGRLTGSLERLHLGVDGFELRVAIPMVSAFPGLAVGLQAETQAPQQPSDELLARAEATLSLGTGQNSAGSG